MLAWARILLKWNNFSKSKLSSLRSDENYSKTSINNFLLHTTDEMYSFLINSIDKLQG